MWRDAKPGHWDKHVHGLFNHAALGDLITSMPAWIYARKTVSPATTLHAWVPEHQIPLWDRVMSCSGALTAGDMITHRLDQFNEFHQAAKLKGHPHGGPVVMNSSPQNTQTRNKTTLVDFAFSAMLDFVPHPTDTYSRSYPITPPMYDSAEIRKRFPELPVGPYIVITTGATSDNKITPPHCIEAALKWANENGCSVVALGKSTTHVKAMGDTIPLQMRNTLELCSQDVQDQIVTLRDKTDLLEAHSIISAARVVAGVDGGMLHLAGLTETPIVYGITTVHPEHRMIYRHGEPGWRVDYVQPSPSLGCRACQSNWVFAYGHDFRECAYDDFACVSPKYYPPEPFVDAIDKMYHGRA